VRWVVKDYLDRGVIESMLMQCIGGRESRYWMSLNSGSGDVWDYRIILYVDPNGKGLSRREFDCLDPSKKGIVETEFYSTKCRVQPLGCCVEHLQRETGISVLDLPRADSVCGERSLPDYLVEQWKEE